MIPSSVASTLLNTVFYTQHPSSSSVSRRPVTQYALTRCGGWIAGSSRFLRLSDYTYPLFHTLYADSIKQIVAYSLSHLPVPLSRARWNIVSRETLRSAAALTACGTRL